MKRVGSRPGWSWQSWLLDPRRSGGVLIDLHIHDTDFVRYLLGDPLKVDSVGSGRKGAWNHIWTRYQYKNVTVHAEAGWDMPPAYGFCMAYRAVFERGMLDYDSGRTPALTLYPARGKARHPKPPAPRVRGRAGGGNVADLGGYGNEIQYFVDCLSKGREPAVTTARDARDSLALVLKEVRSADAKAKR
jgi:predicted dehydrogenase